MLQFTHPHTYTYITLSLLLVITEYSALWVLKHIPKKMQSKFLHLELTSWIKIISEMNSLPKVTTSMLCLSLWEAGVLATLLTNISICHLTIIHLFFNMLFVISRARKRILMVSSKLSSPGSKTYATNSMGEIPLAKDHEKSLKNHC